MPAILALLLALSACGQEFMGRPVARTMTHHGAPWLTRDSRIAQERPDRLHAALDLVKGETACDIGAGNGFHTLRLAKAVGRKGQAVAIDIQPEMLALLRERAEAAGVDNVRYVQNTQSTLGVAPGTCDVALLVDVYHEFSDPKAMLRALREGLAPDGELVLVEFREEDPQVPIKPRHKMSKAQVHKELTAHGFKLVRELDTLPWQHAMFYRRTDGPGAAIAPTPWSR